MAAAAPLSVGAGHGGAGCRAPRAPPQCIYFCRALSRRNKAQVGARRPRAFATALVPNPSSPDVLMPLLAESPRPASRGRRGSSMKCAHESPKAELLE